MADNNQNGQQKPGLSWSQPAQSNQSAGGQRPTNSTPSMKPTNNTPKDGSGSTGWWMVGGVVVLVALVAWAFVAARHSNTAASEAMTASTTSDTMGTTTPGMTATVVTTTMATSTMNPAMPSGTVPMGMSSDASQLTVPTPQTAGASVTVSNIIVSNPTWVVVYEDNNGKPGNALGAALFISGRTNGTVDLLRNTIAGETYLVTEAQDSGNHMFSLQDAPVLDQNGNQVWVEFAAN